jgi:geranylgeranyl diphosphate synthase type 3
MLGCCDIMENSNMCLNYHQSGILRQRTKDVELKKYCVTLLEKFGSFKYTRHTLEKFDAELRAEVAELGGNPMLEDVLDVMLDWKRDT